MPTVTPLQSSSLAPEQINAIASGYLALERARIHRRLCVARFGLTALALAAVAAVRWVPAAVAWVSIATCVVVPGWAWLAERNCARRLERRLDEVAVNKVVKSS